VMSLDGLVCWVVVFGRRRWNSFLKPAFNPINEGCAAR
jgi:hypothetical protein